MDVVNTTSTGTFANINKIGPIAGLIDTLELAKWLTSSQAPVLASSGDIVLGLYTDGQDFDRDYFNGKKGFLFYNGILDIKHDFNFQGVIVATQGIAIKNGEINVTYDQASAIQAVALNTVATKIFLNVTGSSSASGTYKGASNSGNVKMNNQGVTVVSWNTVK